MLDFLIRTSWWDNDDRWYHKRGDHLVVYRSGGIFWFRYRGYGLYFWRRGLFPKLKGSGIRWLKKL